VRDVFIELSNLRIGELLFSRLDTARLLVMGMVGLALVALVLRSIAGATPGRLRIAVPALLESVHGSTFAFLRHIPLVLVLAGLPLFALALADPYTPLGKTDVTYQGRRIALMLDASSSMRVPFTAKHLNALSETEASFFTNVGAAQRFVKLRMAGKYRDLMALIEFGNEAYVVTPFTNDYNNILLSMSLIGDAVEFARFPDQGTIIAQAIDQSVQLFKAFGFLHASGNLMVIFSDGEDIHAMVNGRSLDDILAGAVAAKVPIYFIRTNYSKGEGAIIPDELWKNAVEKTGGKFFAGSNEAAILGAINEIDHAAVGAIDAKQYSTQVPRFTPFALGAFGLWGLAALLTLLVPQFRRFP
jgi:von Willebrand factor type A domain